MTVGSAVQRRKAIDAFKGVINTYKLDQTPPREASEHPDYVSTLKMFRDQDGRHYDLVHERDALDRLLNCIERMFPGQVDRKPVRRHLQESITDWIEEGRDPGNSAQMEKAAARFLDDVERDIKDRLVFIPIDGLRGSYPDGLQLGRCELFHNSRHSELRRLLEADRKRLPALEDYTAVEKASAFLRVRLTAHIEQARRQAVQEARLALNVLRLFIGSYVLDVYRRKIPRCMGLLGTLPTGSFDVVFDVHLGVPVEDQYPGSSVSIKHCRPFELSPGAGNRLVDNGLERINQLVCDAGLASKGSINLRLLRAINWFGKATTADSMADSYLLYAIAAESLLSEGRTGKESYGNRIAALVTREEDSYPVYHQRISLEFDKELERHPIEHFRVVKERVVELFYIRNGVAHGRLLGDEIEPSDLIDLETLVRCSILSFVLGGWGSLAEYRDWLELEHSL